MKLGILKSYHEIDDLVDSYRKSCEACGVDSVVLDLFSDNWIEEIREAQVDGILVREKANVLEYKEMYNERLWVITRYLHIPIYPSYHELFLYENKRMYAYFFETHGINTPKTHVFYSKEKALSFVKEAKYPLVFKTNGGSAGSGVTIIQSKRKARRIINAIFGRINPRLSFGYFKYARVGGFLPVPKLGMSQRHYVIIQDYVNIETEWRIIKIGDTFAGYKRPIVHGHASCDLMEFGMPQEQLLQVIKNVADIEHFDSISMDIIIDKNGQYYVTEMQSLYGSFNPVQCMVDGKPGRIIYKDSKFVFEEGDSFFLLNSNILRVKDFVEKINRGYYCLG